MFRGNVFRINPNALRHSDEKVVSPPPILKREGGGVKGEKVKKSNARITRHAVYKRVKSVVPSPGDGVTARRLSITKCD